MIFFFLLILKALDGCLYVVVEDVNLNTKFVGKFYFDQ